MTHLAVVGFAHDALAVVVEVSRQAVLANVGSNTSVAKCHAAHSFQRTCTPLAFYTGAILELTTLACYSY